MQVVDNLQPVHTIDCILKKKLLLLLLTNFSGICFLFGNEEESTTSWHLESSETCEGADEAGQWDFWYKYLEFCQLL